MELSSPLLLGAGLISLSTLTYAAQPASQIAPGAPH
jgi:hypothetical protein